MFALIAVLAAGNTNLIKKISVGEKSSGHKKKMEPYFSALSRANSK